LGWHSGRRHHGGSGQHYAGEQNSNLDLLRITDPVAPGVPIQPAARAAETREPEAADVRQLRVRVYPNPATDRVTLQFTAPEAGQRVVKKIRLLK
jgi:hypothetical protein